MENYEFCARWVLDQASSGRGVRVLDYGCGAGQIVQELRRQHIDAYGCDVFYEGGDYSKLIASELFEKGVIFRMDGDVIPFDDGYFDFVINNQVLEHVPDLEAVLAEMHRVLKPGGMVLSLFPDKGVWREGHCGIPFLHWFSSSSRIRLYYACGFRALGFGYHKGTKSVMRRSQDFCEWLDKWTCYRSRWEIDAAYTQFFSDIRHIEDYWLQLRLRDKNYLASRLLPASIQKIIVRKLGGMVFVARKRGAIGAE